MIRIPANSLLFFSILFLLSVCNIQAQNAVVTVNQDKQIDRLLSLKKEINSTESNYKIQIYNGNRSGAEEARLEFEKSFSDWSTKIKYETPNYKIWIGNFKTRLEADRALLKVKKKFGSAFIFKPKKEREKS
ncbi:MAG: SPOR domain-containing protein [Flavobacteriaceae bacterium]|nr:SPOR domain-containing protein [Flavobacteriaceae bacterium]